MKLEFKVVLRVYRIAPLLPWTWFDTLESRVRVSMIHTLGTPYV